MNVPTLYVMVGVGQWAMSFRMGIDAEEEDPPNGGADVIDSLVERADESEAVELGFVPTPPRITSNRT